jgi:hypothetical protein
MKNFEYGHNGRPVWKPKVFVFCSCCGKIDEEKVEFIGIEEDIMGADVLTFRCPNCKTVQKSNRYG